MTAELSARLKASGTLCRTCRGRGRASPLCSSIRGDILPQRCPRRWLKKKIAGLVEHCSDPGGDVLRWKQNSAARRAARVTAQRCCKVATRAVCPPGHEQSAACSLCPVKREPYLEKIVSSERPRFRDQKMLAPPQVDPQGCRGEAAKLTGWRRGNAAPGGLARLQRFICIQLLGMHATR